MKIRLKEVIAPVFWPVHRAVQSGRVQEVVTIMEETNASTAPQTPAPYAAGTGTAPVGTDRAAFDRMGYRERLALKRDDPETYRALRG